jgi:magnesium chelatase subunit I
MMMNNQKLFTDVFLKEDDPFSDILGQDEVKSQLKSALISERHILIVGPPGIGKTTLAKNIAKLLPKQTGKSEEGLFVRIQGSPDLTAEDLIGDIDPVKALKFGPQSMEAFTPGKIFRANKGILFFDEVNRCPEKVQNSLLQVLEEKKATIGSYKVDITADFIFIGTMNPEDSSTETLSDVFLDRFDVIYMGYPETVEIEMKIVGLKAEKRGIKMSDELTQLAVSFVRLLRDNKKLEKKPSVRASIGLIERSCANALLDKRKSVIFEDLKKAVLSVIAHRIRLKPSYRFITSSSNFVVEEFNSFTENYREEDERGEGL